MAAQSAQLVAISEGPNILLDKPIILIGRHQECDIQIPSRKVSRRHCCIAQVNDYFVVRDLCSTNGIRINGVRVNEGQLKPGDELTIGNFRYQIEPPEQQEVPVKKSPKTGRRHDDSLESCDEPIPLDDPDPPVRSAKGSAPPASLLFPDKIQLAPLSDSQMNQRK